MNSGMNIAMRRKLVVGNWKMYGRLARNKALLESVLQGVKGMKNADYAVCVPYPYLSQAQTMLQGSNLAWGAQNLSQNEEGAFTGAVAPGMLTDFGCRYVIIGHSERRAIFHESNEIAAAKFDAAIKQHPNLQCVYTITRPDGSPWDGRTGRFDGEFFGNHLGPSGTLYYLCGPDQMIKEQSRLLTELGVPSPMIRTERW